MAVADNFAMNASLPFYPFGNVSGAVLTLSQNPCNNPYRRNTCCTPTHKSHEVAHAPGGYTCANWTGEQHRTRAPRAVRATPRADAPRARAQGRTWSAGGASCTAA